MWSCKTQKYSTAEIETDAAQCYFVDFSVWDKHFFDEMYRIKRCILSAKRNTKRDAYGTAKNIVQIGRPDKVHKIFCGGLYVASYIKQLNKACDGRAVGIALYGRHCEEEGCHYYFCTEHPRYRGWSIAVLISLRRTEKKLMRQEKVFLTSMNFWLGAASREPLESFCACTGKRN